MPRSQPEAAFQQQIMDLARMLGWRVCHFGAAQTEKGYRTPVRGDGKGWPDLVLAKAGRAVIYAELKSETGRLSAEQQNWLGVLRAAKGADVYLWRPSDWDEVEAVLRGLPSPRGRA